MGNIPSTPCCAGRPRRSRRNGKPLRSEFRFMDKSFQGISTAPRTAPSILADSASDSFFAIDLTQEALSQSEIVDEPLIFSKFFRLTEVEDLDAEIEAHQAIFEQLWEITGGLQQRIDVLTASVFKQNSFIADEELFLFVSALSELNSMLSDEFSSAESRAELVGHAKSLYKRASLILEYAFPMQSQAKACTKSWSSHLNNLHKIKEEFGFASISSKSFALKKVLKNNYRKTQETEMILSQAIRKSEAVLDLFYEVLSNRVYRELFGEYLDQNAFQDMLSPSSISVSLMNVQPNTSRKKESSYYISQDEDIPRGQSLSLLHQNKDNTSDRGPPRSHHI